MFISFAGINAIIQSRDPSQDFFFDGTKGLLGGSVTLASDGGAPWVQEQTIAPAGAKYTILLEDPNDLSTDMVRVRRMTVNFRLRESGRVCSFVWQGVMTPAAFFPGG
jgi:hypothetical protein